MEKVIVTTSKYCRETHERVLGKQVDVEGNEFYYQPERSKREDLIKELGKFKPKSLRPEDGYLPPPWNINDHLEKTIGWFEFQKAMKEDPEYYLGCGALNTMET